MATGRRITMETPAEPRGERTLEKLWEWAVKATRSLQQLRDANDDGYPVPHAATHKLPAGTVDSVASASLPGALVAGAPGTLGDPMRGFAAGDHTHDTTALAASGGASSLSSVDLEWLHWRV